MCLIFLCIHPIFISICRLLVVTSLCGKFNFNWKQNAVSEGLIKTRLQMILKALSTTLSAQRSILRMDTMYIQYFEFPCMPIDYVKFVVLLIFHYHCYLKYVYTVEWMLGGKSWEIVRKHFKEDKNKHWWISTHYV